jgi:hypothetical protein
LRQLLTLCYHSQLEIVLLSGYDTISYCCGLRVFTLPYWNSCKQSQNIFITYLFNEFRNPLFCDNFNLGIFHLLSTHLWYITSFFNTYVLGKLVEFYQFSSVLSYHTLLISAFSHITDLLKGIF